MDWTLKITRVDNGYILEGNPDEDGIHFHEVLEEDLKDDLNVHESLLWSIMDYFAFNGSKHDKERLHVIRQKRDE